MPLAALKTFHWSEKREHHCRCVLAIFEDWTAPYPTLIEERRHTYAPPDRSDLGLLFLHNILKSHPGLLAVVLLDSPGDPYTGLHVASYLYEMAGLPVIEVASEAPDKDGFSALMRGADFHPLYLRTTGFPQDEALDGLAHMVGPRIPTILSLVASRAQGCVD